MCRTQMEIFLWHKCIEVCERHKLNSFSSICAIYEYISVGMPGGGGGVELANDVYC